MKKYFWLLFVILSGFGIYLSIAYFDKAIPLLDIEISTDKNSMLQMAREISEKYNIGPKEFKQVIYFNSEHNTQNYIELELNGLKSTQDIIKNELYYPYTWQVRHFQQYNPNECIIKLTPDGKFYGFVEHISEDKLIQSLSGSQAKELVEEFLKTEAHIDLTDYIEVSSSSEIRINGRVDHTFVYQKNILKNDLDHKNNLKYRITLTVCGDKITVFNHYIDIPELFNRKFAQLSTVGETISSFANMFMYVFYIFFGCLVGLIYLIKKNWLIPKKSMIMGIILASAELIYNLNEIPLIWVNYNTAHSVYSHLLNHLIGDLVLFLISTVTYSATVAVAEGLTRLAFDYHIQFFKLLNPKVLSSAAVVKKSLISYLILPLNIAFVILFYTLGIKYLGWWSPSAYLISPNILSTYFPGLSVLAQGFRAGFWEECLFRAIPLSFFYIISRRFKYKNSILFLGLIIQALVFSAGHASYLTIPSYVRVIELIIPSIMFGIVYIKLGLLSAILIHFTYDTLFLSLPLLVSNDIVFEKLIIIIGFFIPLIIPVTLFLIRKLYNFKNYNPNYLNNLTNLNNLDDKFYNKSWKSKVVYLDNTPHQKEPDIKLFSNKFLYAMAFISIVLFGTSLWLAKLTPDVEKISITKEQAVDIAKKFLKKKNINIDLDKSWSILTSIYNPQDKILEEKFIWQKDKELYRLLAGLNYVHTPCFRIRFVKFESSNIEREEEHDIYIAAHKGIIRYKHVVPSDFPGKYLFKDQAKELALNFIVDKFKIDKSNIEEVVSKMIERKDRQDWEFIFRDTTSNLFGMAGKSNIKNLDKSNIDNNITKQITINISGSEITDAYKNIFIPQDWLRVEEYNKQLHHIASLITGALFLFFIAIAFLRFLSLFKEPTFKLDRVKVFFITYSILVIYKRFLILPEIISNFSTSKPFLSQIISSELMALVSSIAQIISVTLLFAVIINYSYRKQLVNNENLKNSLILSCSVSFFISAAFIFLQYFTYPARPVVVGYAQLNSYWPSLLYIIENILNYLNNAIYFIFIVRLAQYKFNLKSVAVFLFAASTIIPLDIFYSINQWSAFSFYIFLILFFVYIVLIRFDIVLVPLIYNFIYQLILIKNYLVQDYPIFYIVKLSIIPTIISMLSVLICCLIIIKSLKYKDKNYS